jgi:hypothetical protein
MSVLFNGSTLVTPAVETSIDDSAMYPIANPYGNVLALIGESAGGTPKKATRVRSPQHAKQLLRSGPLYEAAVRAFAPSPEAGSPASILVVRVDPAVQATLTLNDADEAPSIALSATDYGAHTSSIEVRLEAGSRLGYRLSVRQDSVVATRDNVGSENINLQYTGTEADAAIDIAAGVLTLKAPADTVAKTYNLNEWANVAALAEAINGMSDWAASVPRGQERFEPENLDKQTFADAKTAAVTVTGHAYEVVKFLQSASEIWLDAALADAQVAAPALLPWTTLSGGVNGNVVALDWENAFAALHEVEAHWLVPLTDDAAVWDMCAAHCDYLSEQKRERRAFVGADTGVTAEQAAVHALAINSDRVGYVWPAIYEQDSVTRQPVLKPAYLAAVNLAASFASMNPGETMSRKALSVYGAEVQLREPADTDVLIDSGVIALVQGTKGVIVSQAVSTWQVDDRYNRREISTGAATDYVARAVRANLEPLLGTRASPEAIPRAASRVESILSDLSVAPPSGPGVLVGDGASPPYKNIVVELEGDVMRVSFECSPVIPINYVLVGISISPYAGSSTNL